MKNIDSAPLIVFAGGGTGGHLYPALALAEALRRRCPDVQFVFYGSQRAVDQKILDAHQGELVRQSLSPLSVKPWRWPGILGSIWQARNVCRQAFHTHPPLAVVGTGGLASVPAVLESVRAGIPTALINPDVIPGKANRFLASRLDVVFAQFADSKAYFSKRTKVAVTGCPVRPEFLTARREDGIRRFGLDEQRKTLLITGASQGARTINEAVLANAGNLAQRSNWQILHLTGDADHDMARETYQRCSARATVLNYTEHMAEALAAADLVVSRAGASTLAELTALGRASVLFPYPFHRDRHQEANAVNLVQGGAAVMLRDRREASLNGPLLGRTLNELLDEPERIGAMSEAARCLGRPSAATEMADLLLEIIARRCGCTAYKSLQQSPSSAR